ncbi:hypothetical protein A8B98_18660 [Hymenobacter sp. UV11]|nr:hypothetical protein A8B98_18660 [Hymenobacter sp. UV11]
MLFSSSKTGHFAQILTSGLLGDVVVNQLTPPDPVVIQQWGSMIIQFLVAGVTIWATIRKALQKPEAVVKVPADVVPVIAAAVVPSAVSLPAADVTGE